MDKTTFTFRPRNDNLTVWKELRRQLQIRGLSVSTLFNSILPMLNAELSFQKPNENKVYEVNLGVIKFEDKE